MIDVLHSLNFHKYQSQISVHNALYLLLCFVRPQAVAFGSKRSKWPTAWW